MTNLEMFHKWYRLFVGVKTTKEIVKNQIYDECKQAYFAGIRMSDQREYFKNNYGNKTVGRKKIA